MNNIKKRLFCDIIIPVYNGEKYLKKTIKSIISQSIFKNLKIIIINDGSSDNSSNIINYYEKNYENFKSINNKENKGFIESINLGIKNSTSDFFLILGQDDILANNHIEMMVNTFDKNTSLVYCNSIIIDKNNKKLKKFDKKFKIFKKHFFINYYLIFSNPIRSTGAIINRKLYNLTDGYNKKFKNFGERDIWIKLAKVGNIKINKKVYAYYRKHESNITNTFQNKEMSDQIKIYNKMCSDLALKILFHPIYSKFLKIIFNRRINRN